MTVTEIALVIIATAVCTSTILLCLLAVLVDNVRRIARRTTVTITPGPHFAGGSDDGDYMPQRPHSGSGQSTARTPRPQGPMSVHVEGGVAAAQGRVRDAETRMRDAQAGVTAAGLNLAQSDTDADTAERKAYNAFVAGVPESHLQPRAMNPTPPVESSRVSAKAVAAEVMVARNHIREAVLGDTVDQTHAAALVKLHSEIGAAYRAFTSTLEHTDPPSAPTNADTFGPKG